MSELQGLWTEFEYKPHQVSGVHWMMERETAHNPGGLLCDEMGLGKTIEVLGCVINNPVRNTLLLCPKAVISQWVAAGLRSSLNVCVFRKGKHAGVWDVPIDYFPGRPFIFVTNYDKVTDKNEAMFRRRNWNRLVMDEAHRVVSTNLSKQIKQLNRNITWCVTATPIVNSLKDIRTLFEHVGYARSINYSQLQGAVKEACMYRSMLEMRPILKELPDAPTVVKEKLDFDTSEEAEFYRGIQGATVRLWKATDQDSHSCRFALLMRLRQISVHPQVYIKSVKAKHPGIYNRPDWTAPSTKFNALKTRIESGAVGAKWIVFCQFHDEIKLLTDYLATSSAVRNIHCYHGKMTMEEKEDVIKATKNPLDVDGRSDILLLQLQSGGVGLNLQHFSRIVFMSPWWTNAMMEQAIGRAVRIGQTEKVEVTIFSLNGEDCLNIDEQMLSRGFTKRGVMERLFEVAFRGGLMPDVALDYEKEMTAPGEDEPKPQIPDAAAAEDDDDDE